MFKNLKYLILLLSLLLTACTTSTKGSVPSKPTNVTIQAQDSQVVISWNAVSGATSYNIYLASETGVDKVNYKSKANGQKVTNASSPHTLSGLTNGVIYYFIVTAINSNGESVESIEVPAEPTAQNNQFNPTKNTKLPAGNYDFDSINIPEGVKVILEGESTFNVTGDIIIAGTLESDCDTLSLLGKGDISITGEVNTECNDPNKSGDIIIETTEGIDIGTSDVEAKIEGSGEVIIRDPTLEEWMFDIPFDADTQLAAQQTGTIAPVCSASSDVVTGSASADFPIEISFSGKGVDPDRGPVTYSWDFDDGGSSTQQNPKHTFTAAGIYDIKLTVKDNENETCMATLRLVFEDNVTTPEAPAVWVEPDTSPLPPLVAAIGQTVDFPSLVEDLQSKNENLTYSWDFGDGSAKSSEANPNHTYTKGGRYEISLTITDPENNTSIATASVYIVALSKPAPPPPGGCGPPLIPPPNYHLFNAAIAGRNGVFGLRIGNYIFGPATRITGLNGPNGAAQAGSNSATGKDGENGTSVTIFVTGHLIICGGTYTSGDGGNGGAATATSAAPATARARGGNGGKSGNLRITAGKGVEFRRATTINIGDGGNGGVANATGGNGKDDCTSAQKGGSAEATGGAGGNSNKFVTAFNTVGLGLVTVNGGNGGNGGVATAKAGKGGKADCPKKANGGNGGNAKALGGQGGGATLAGAGGFVLGAGAFTGGNGGNATATGGNGGDAIAKPNQPCQSTEATAGNGGRADARAGKKGAGRIDGIDGNAIAQAGHGGKATAKGGDCNTNDGANGGNAEATGGDGGNATARRGATSTAKAGNGGNATANGGKGANCVDCAKRDGGNGGNATANGGEGGNASGDGTNTDGNGGNATANGGMGGTGDNGCTLLIKGRGGNGGKGGDATANAGTSKGTGQTGQSGGKAGDGGDGNDGIPPDPPGNGGPAGTPKGSPTKPQDGKMGAKGNPCPQQQVFKLSIDTSGSGTGIVKVDPPMPAGGYPKGTKVTLTAVANPNSVFDSWSGDASGKNPVVMITMDSNKSVIVTFVKTYELKIEIEGNGKVGVTPLPNAPNNRYKEGTNVNLTASPAQGNELKKWEGDCAGSTGNTCSLTMDNDKMAKAIFGPPFVDACQLLFDNFNNATIFVIQKINQINIIDPSLHFLELLGNPVEPQLRQLLIQMIISFIIINDSTNVDFPQPLVDVEGGFKYTQNGTCTIAAMGVGPLFPESNVEAQLDATIDPNTGIMNATYTLGINGTIGGQPPVVEFEAQLAAQ